MTTILDNQRPRKVSDENFGIRSTYNSETTDTDDMFVRAQPTINHCSELRTGNGFDLNKLESGKHRDVAIKKVVSTDYACVVSSLFGVSCCSNG